MSWVQLLFSADSAKDRSVANVCCLIVFLQPLSHFTTDRQIRQMVRRPRCAPQFNRSLPYPLAIWLLARSLRRGRVRGHLAIKPVEKILLTIANSELLIGSMWSSLIIRTPDLSASRTTAAALPLLKLRRQRTSAIASPNDSNEGVGSTALSFDAGDGRCLLKKTQKPNRPKRIGLGLKAYAAARQVV